MPEERHLPSGPQKSVRPAQEPERTVEAVRRALPELLKLDRYETRVVSRRDRAIREIAKIRSSRDRLTLTLFGRSPMLHQQ
jgi:hypothetical protein